MQIPPNNGANFQIATQLMSKVHELSALNDKYNSPKLNSVFNKEGVCIKIIYIGVFYNGNVKPKSLNELEKLMHDATFHIRLYFWNVLSDIEF